MALQIKAQVIHILPRPIDLPVKLKVDYWPGDKRTRDVSGMLDALFHLLVYTKVLKDDGLVRDVIWRYNGVNRQFPKVALELDYCE
jgi:Holliday junction resolvase RusA-like endonuclease